MLPVCLVFYFSYFVSRNGIFIESVIPNGFVNTTERSEWMHEKEKQLHTIVRSEESVSSSTLARIYPLLDVDISPTVSHYVLLIAVC